jgi:hypothetical protein
MTCKPSEVTYKEVSIKMTHEPSLSIYKEVLIWKMTRTPYESTYEKA